MSIVNAIAEVVRVFERIAIALERLATAHERRNDGT